MIKYMDIVEYDDKNSDDFSLTIFFSHCDFRCEGCQNPSTQSGEIGSAFTKDIEEYVYKKYKVMVEEELANRGLLKKLKDAVVAAFHG